MTNQNSTATTRHTREQLEEKYSIKTAQYYERIKYLGIKAHKQGKEPAYLDDEQVELLDSLHEHIKLSGKMEGFRQGNSGGELATVENSGGMVSAVGTIEVDIPQTQPDYTNVDSAEINSLFRKAAEIKAQNLVTPELVVLNLAAQMSEEDLPQDLKQKVEEVRGAANPKHQPAQLASNLLAQYRATRGGN